MEIPNYKSNSDKNREEQNIDKKIKPVVPGSATIRKKNNLQKTTNDFIAESARNVWLYILKEVIEPSAKKAISDIVKTGIDMFLYGEADSSKKHSMASKISYRNYYDQSSNLIRANTIDYRQNGLKYDDILFETRGDAEAVLDAMHDIISQFGSVSVSDFYELARVPNDNFTMARYGWSNISGASAIRVRDGYILKLPRVIPLN